MGKKALPKRVFNSPLIIMAKFKNETVINLIRLNKPYKDGKQYAIYCSDNDLPNLMFKSSERAEKAFFNLVGVYSNNSEVIKVGKTENY